jgi:phosphatidylserine/phosphatidylglycerophosphate/cardiolipin synthase-like enzyme
VEADVAIPLPSVYFSPCGGCTAAIVAAVTAARCTVLVSAYEFTSSEIASALLAARSAGASVQLILDPTQRYQHGSQSHLLSISNIPVLYDPCHAIYHDKFMVIDSRFVITGSFNYTPAAEFHNAENLIFVDSPQIAALYAANWLAHKAHSVA